MNRYSNILVAAVVMAFAVSACGKKEEAKAPAEPKKVEEKKEAKADEGALPATIPTKGGDNALVTIVEISDFQCPFCSRVGPTIKQIEKEYGDKVRIAWVNNALPFHKDARPAAIAGLAAHRQGKFWEMHDKLFANQRELTEDNFKKWAKELGLDVAKFEKDLKDPELGKQVDRDQKAANAVGARGTPAFFINGKLLSGAQPFANFKKEIDEAITKAEPVAKGGKSGRELLEAVFNRDAANGPKLLGFLLGKEEPPAVAQRKPQERKAPTKPPPDSYQVWKVKVPEGTPMKGNKDAPITIVEFSDFECPFCNRATNTLNEVVKANGDKVRVFFMHNPLPFHKNAKPAHQAAIAADAQGKFWEMHDKLFENFRTLTEENIKKWAGELGLDMGEFDKVRNDKKTAARIAADMELGQTVSVRGTPNFFINGRKIVGAQPKEMFQMVIDEELKKAEKSDKKGEAYYESVIANGKVFSELDDKVNEFDVSKLPYKGKKDAPVTIVEFSDFQCPFCSRVPGPLKETVENYKGKVKVVFAHFPLSFHKMAMPASVMAQEAFVQGGSEKFWEAHDKLFAAQRELSVEKIDGIAKEIGLDMKKYEAAKKSGDHEKLIKDTMAMGTKGGVRGTPTLFINGRKFQPLSGYNAAAFGKVVDKLLK